MAEVKFGFCFFPSWWVLRKSRKGLSWLKFWNKSISLHPVTHVNQCAAVIPKQCAVMMIPLNHIGYNFSSNSSAPYTQKLSVQQRFLSLKHSVQQ